MAKHNGKNQWFKIMAKHSDYTQWLNLSCAYWPNLMLQLKLNFMPKFYKHNND